MNSPVIIDTSADICCRIGICFDTFHTSLEKIEELENIELLLHNDLGSSNYYLDFLQDKFINYPEVRVFLADSRFIICHWRLFI